MAALVRLRVPGAALSLATSILLDDVVALELFSLLVARAARHAPLAVREGAALELGMEAIAVVSLVGRQAHGTSVHPNAAVSRLRASKLGAAMNAGNRFASRQAKSGSRVE